MKIALITVHHANSYGGMLQAFATKEVLSQFGEVTFINYTSDHLANTMRIVNLSLSVRSFLRTAKNLARLFPRYRLLKKFRMFQEENFPQTALLRNGLDLKAQEKEFDVFVCGSDQIWNPKITEGFDEAYFLGFIENKKKVSFASSAGSYVYTAPEAVLVKQYLKSFSSIGVREEDLNDRMSLLLGRDDITTVLDPTLLLSPQDWIEYFNIELDDRIQPYLLVYALKISKNGYRAIELIAKQLGLRVLAIDQEPFLRYKVDKHLNDVGPEEYLSLIANASFVVTDSFHGTAFSLNFNIPFITISPSTGVNRVQTLLAAVGLEDRILINEKMPNLTFSFDDANKKLVYLREKSLAFLESTMVDG
ncbi:MAG: polysaccharide pyruvyl transferase family protein [Colwellia sp.]